MHPDSPPADSVQKVVCKTMSGTPQSRISFKTNTKMEYVGGQNGTLRPANLQCSDVQHKFNSSLFRRSCLLLRPVGFNRRGDIGGKEWQGHGGVASDVSLALIASPSQTNVQHLKKPEAQNKVDLLFEHSSETPSSRTQNQAACKTDIIIVVS